MLRIFVKFLFFLFLSLGLAYLLHIYVYSSIAPTASLELIKFSYKFNAGFTLLFTSSIILFSKKLKNQIGLIFLVASALKMGIFLFVVETSGLVLYKSVFLNFFIPYVLSVVLEITYLIKVIKLANSNIDN